MTNGPTGGLALKDQAGNYYIFSEEALDRARVPAEREAEVERLIAEVSGAQLNGDDVQGHLLQVIAGGLAAGTAILIGVSLGALASMTNDGPSPPTDPRHLQQGHSMSRPL